MDDHNVYTIATYQYIVYCIDQTTSKITAVYGYLFKEDAVKVYCLLVKFSNYISPAGIDIYTGLVCYDRTIQRSRIFNDENCLNYSNKFDEICSKSAVKMINYHLRTKLLYENTDTLFKIKNIIELSDIGPYIIYNKKILFGQY